MDLAPADRARANIKLPDGNKLYNGFDYKPHSESSPSWLAVKEDAGSAHKVDISSMNIFQVCLKYDF